jgi:ketosteroid isomerase-like protein
MLPGILQDHLTAVTTDDGRELDELWERDGVVEFPYAEALGKSTRLDGLDAIRSYFGPPRRWTDWAFSELRGIVDPAGREGFVEFHGSARVAETGEQYEQDYVVYFRIGGDGRLALWREYWDPTRVPS